MVTPCDASHRRRRPYRAVVFDFDGTLALLNLDFESMRTAVVQLAQEFSLTPAPHEGTPLLEWLHETASRLEGGRNGAAGSRLLQQADGLIREMEVLAARQGELFGFTRPLLCSLRRAGVRTAIITRNCTPALQTTFPDALEHTFTVLTRDDVGQVKPHPEHLGSALRHLGCAPEEALMVGDHPIDMATGHNAGTDSAGVSSGRMSQEELTAAGACHVARDALDLCRDLSRKGLLPLLDI